MKSNLLILILALLPAFAHSSGTSRCSDFEQWKSNPHEGLDPFDHDFHERLLRCLVESGEYVLAFGAAKEVLEREGDYPYLYHHMGRSYYGAGLYEKAIEFFRYSVESGGYGYEDAVYMARAYRGLNDLDGAASILREYLEFIEESFPEAPDDAWTVHPAEVNAIFELSDVYIDSDNIDAAREVLIYGVRRNSGSRRMYDALMAFLGKHGPQDLYDRYMNKKKLFLDNID
ncbi:MAG: hypothetical protein P1U78_10205 [Alcanivoracaceae bacterium]|nr:hypothetical protein [Alcanivoracaceae bacterium]